MSFLNVVSQIASRRSAIPIVIDCGSAITKLAYKGRMLWEQPTVVAVDRMTDECVSIGYTAALQLAADASHRLRIVHPVINGIVSNLSVLQSYLNELLKQIAWVDGSTIPSLTPLVMIERFGLSLVSHSHWVSACQNLGRKVTFVTEKTLIAALTNTIQLPTWIIDLGYSHTSCAFYDADGFSVTSTFPWGLNRILIALEQTTLRQDMLLTPQQLEMVLQQIVSVPTTDGSKMKRKISLTVKQLSTGASVQSVLSEKDIEIPINVIIEEWLWVIKQQISHLASAVDTAKVAKQLYCFGGGSLLRGFTTALSSELSLQVSSHLSGITSMVVPLAQTYDRKK